MPDLEHMVRRQRVLADFGDLALRSEDLGEILNQACRLVSEALKTDLAKIMEIDHERQDLLVIAGVGWIPGIVGQTRLPMGERSSETYSIKQGQPVTSRDIGEEERFDFPAFMKANGVVAIVNVPIFLPGRRAYGLLQVDSRTARSFTREDIEFLRTYAAILGPVIDRLHKVHALRVARDTNRHLLQELQHRIKNHIGIISSLVKMRRREVASGEARRELTLIGERIETLRLVHEQLYAAGGADRLSLEPYVVRLVENICRMQESHSGKIRLAFAIEPVELDADTVIPLGLILNEFVTNSLKYAFGGQGGTIAVAVKTLAEGGISVRISDDGKGLPAVPRQAAAGSGTGLKLIGGLAEQLGAQAVWSSSGGTALWLQFAPP